MDKDLIKLEKENLALRASLMDMVGIAIADGWIDAVTGRQIVLSIALQTLDMTRPINKITE